MKEYNGGGKYTTLTMRKNFKEEVLDPLKKSFGDSSWEQVLERLIKNYYKECVIHVDEEILQKFNRLKGSYAEDRFMEVLLSVYEAFLLK